MGREREVQIERDRKKERTVRNEKCLRLKESGKRDADGEMKGQGPVWTFGAAFSPWSRRAPSMLFESNHIPPHPIPSPEPSSDDGFASHTVSIEEN